MVGHPTSGSSSDAEFDSHLAKFEHVLGLIKHHIGLFGRPLNFQHDALEAALAVGFVKVPEAIERALLALGGAGTAQEIIAKVAALQLTEVRLTEQRIRETFSKCAASRGWQTETLNGVRIYRLGGLGQEVAGRGARASRPRGSTP